MQDNSWQSILPQRVPTSWQTSWSSVREKPSSSSASQILHVLCNSKFLYRVYKGPAACPPYPEPSQVFSFLQPPPHTHTIYTVCYSNMHCNYHWFLKLPVSLVLYLQIRAIPGDVEMRVVSSCSSGLLRGFNPSQFMLSVVTHQSVEMRGNRNLSSQRSRHNLVRIRLLVGHETHRVVLVP